MGKKEQHAQDTPFDEGSGHTSTDYQCKQVLELTAIDLPSHKM